MNICIFMLSGKTYSFKNVLLHSDNESVLQFQYKAMFDDKIKIGRFYKSNMAGYSTHR